MKLCLCCKEELSRVGALLGGAQAYTCTNKKCDQYHVLVYRE
jgi:hypothetical protein